MAELQVPADGSRWRNRWSQEMATVLRTMACSPGGALDYPIVEYQVDGQELRKWAGHWPWFRLSEWADQWDPVEAEPLDVAESYTEIVILLRRARREGLKVDVYSRDVTLIKYTVAAVEGPRSWMLHRATFKPADKRSSMTIYVSSIEKVEVFDG